MTHFRLSPKWMPLALGFAQRLDEFADDAPAETEIVSGDGRDALTFQVADHVRTSPRTHDLPMARISVSLFQPSVNGMRRAASSESNRRHFDGRPSSPPLALLSLESSPSPVSPSVVTVAHGIVFIHTVCSLPEFFTGFVVGRFSVASVLAGLVVL